MNRSMLMTAAFFLATLGAVMAASARGEYRVSEIRLDNLPFVLLGARGETRDFDQRVYQVLDADKNISRVYVSPSGEQTWMYLGYYGTAKGGRAKHQPQYCYPGSGWDILEMGKEPISHQGKTIHVNRIVVQKGDLRDVALFWNQNRDNVVESGWAMNWRRFTNRLRGDRDDGAFVRISAEIKNGDDMRAVIEREKLFAAQLLVDLPTSWPQEERIGRARPAALLNQFLHAGHSG